MLARRLRRRTNINPALGQCIAFARYRPQQCEHVESIKLKTYNYFLFSEYHCKVMT